VPKGRPRNNPVDNRRAATVRSAGYALDIKDEFA